MDIFQYINSKDIRAHLESIGYRFNALEAAWLVYQCHTATMKEKHAAWREIIDTMPDIRVEFADECLEPFESLHQLLRDYSTRLRRCDYLLISFSTILFTPKLFSGVMLIIINFTSMVDIFIKHHT